MIFDLGFTIEQKECKWIVSSLCQLINLFGRVAFCAGLFYFQTELA
jgi:hypothetical protein